MTALPELQIVSLLGVELSAEDLEILDRLADLGIDIYYEEFSDEVVDPEDPTDPSDEGEDGT